jgi:hypothetical protein
MLPSGTRSDFSCGNVLAGPELALFSTRLKLQWARQAKCEDYHRVHMIIVRQECNAGVLTIYFL